jgi:Holliday junction resolvase RusA-like endonuclease
LEDALRGVVFKDDAQICETLARKRYGEPARVEVKVMVLT